MITEEQAADIAGDILEYPADDPGHGWQLEAFRQGWLVNWHGWEGPPGEFTIVIERPTGLVRYFTTAMPPQAIISEYPLIREEGHPDHRWTVQREPERLRSGREVVGNRYQSARPAPFKR